MSDDCPTKPESSAAEEVARAVDTERAEAILHDVAVELRFVGLRGRAAHLHVQALGLKREVARWLETATGESQRQATIEQLLSLYQEAKKARENKS